MLGRESQYTWRGGVKLVMSPNEELQQTHSALSPSNNHATVPATFSLHCDKMQSGEIIFPFFFFQIMFSISNHCSFLLFPSVYTKSNLISGATSKTNILRHVDSDFITHALVVGAVFLFLKCYYSSLNCNT